MYVINFYGAPGVGKSTCAAYVFSQLKMLGTKVEFVAEYAKEKIWENNVTILSNQVYLFAKQYVGLTRLLGKTDVVVMDSPLLLSVFYNSNKSITDSFRNLVMDCYHEFDNIDYLIKRKENIEYECTGRLQQENEANEIDEQLTEVLNSYVCNYTCIYPDIEYLDSIIKTIAGRCAVI